MRLPEFFIIGAPKCGTTSLALYLGRHREVFIPTVKEPHYFLTDLRRSGRVSNQRAYEALFKRATGHHRVAGEASVFYLLSRAAVPNILCFNPDAKFIVMVRPPLEMVVSMHAEQLWACTENVEDLERAWRLREPRMAGGSLPALCEDPRFLDYSSICRLGEQLDRLYSVVPRDRVKVIALDEMQRNPREIYQEVLGFLGVEDDDPREFRAHNVRKVARMRRVNAVIVAFGRIKRMLGIHRPVHVGKLVLALNRKRTPPEPLRPAFAAELADHFADDVALLGELMGRDLSGWLIAPGTSTNDHGVLSGRALAGERA
jgi:hypothetical protein